jgi:DNA replication protein DnaC
MNRFFNQMRIASASAIIKIPFDPDRTPRAQIEAAIGSLPPLRCERHTHVLRPVDMLYTVQRAFRGGDYDYAYSERSVDFNATFERCLQCPFNNAGHDIEVENCAVGVLRFGKRDFSIRDKQGRPLPRHSGSARLEADRSARKQFEEWISGKAEYRCRLSNQVLRIHDSCMKPPFETWTIEPQFASCPQCELERLGALPDEAHASFGNFVAESPALRQHLEHCRAFAVAPKGVLLLLGNCGTGKTHLAISILRELLSQGKSGLCFIKHRHFLGQCRRALLPVAFGQEPPESPLVRCQDASLLVYDELTAETDIGRPCEDVLLDLFEARIGHHKPSIITANIVPDELEAALGTRLHDRLRRAVYAVLEFGFESRRSNLNTDYLTRRC